MDVNGIGYCVTGVRDVGHVPCIVTRRDAHSGSIAKRRRVCFNDEK